MINTVLEEQEESEFFLPRDVVPVVCVCPSVCLSATLHYYMKTVKHIIDILLFTGSGVVPSL